MRYLLLVLSTVFIIQASGQSFSTYRDTVNGFSIAIPTGWKYGVHKNYPALKLIASRIPLSESDTTRENFNINIIETSNKNFDNTFTDLINSITAAKNFELIDKGDTTLNGIKFKWLIETHQNKINDIKMYNYDFVTLKDGKTYILTMVTFSHTFDAIKPLFDKIASSFTFLN